MKKKDLALLQLLYLMLRLIVYAKWLKTNAERLPLKQRDALAACRGAAGEHFTNIKKFVEGGVVTKWMNLREVTAEQAYATLRVDRPKPRLRLYSDMKSRRSVRIALSTRLHARTAPSEAHRPPQSRAWGCVHD
jgi:hypothetical protein